MVKSEKVLNNMAWRFLERCGSQGVSFVVSVVLARLLVPEAYGTIALITVFTALLQVFINSGLGTALIQKKDADDLDFSTVFYFNVVMCLVLYGLLFLAAPLIAAFYELPELKEIRTNCGYQISTLWPEVKRFDNPHNYYVDLSQKLMDLKDKMLDEAGK